MLTGNLPPFLPPYCQVAHILIFYSRRNKSAVGNGGEKPNAMLFYVLLKLL